MKGLKKLALVSAIAAVSAGAQAELKALDDSALGELTGQAGLTIDAEIAHTIGEFAYHDAGYVILQGLSLGASDNATTFGSTTLLDNFRITIDVAGSGAVGGAGNVDNTFQTRFSEVAALAAVHILSGNGDADMAAAASTITTGGLTQSTDGVGGDTINLAQSYGDGDLLIHIGFTDAWQRSGGFTAVNAGTGVDTIGGGTVSLASMSYASARIMASESVDFNRGIDMIGIAASDYTVGAATGGANVFDTSVNAVTGEINGTNHVTGTDADTSNTALISGLSINGFLGPVDIHIENNGNGFSGPGGTGDADSQINWGTYFNVTDLDVYLDIAGVQLTDITIDNNRGDLTDIFGDASFGFAHSIRTIFAVKDTVFRLQGAGVAAGFNPNGSNPVIALVGGGLEVEYGDGVAINTQFKGDLDIGALSFGDSNVSIGEIYLTDILSTTNWTISGHR